MMKNKGGKIKEILKEKAPLKKMKEKYEEKRMEHYERKKERLEKKLDKLEKKKEESVKKKEVREKKYEEREKIKEQKKEEKIVKKEQKKEEKIVRKEKRKEQVEKMKENINNTKVVKKIKEGKIFKSFKITKVKEFIEKKLEEMTEKEKIKLYDPMAYNVQLCVENIDKICFHFTLAKPMNGVSIKGAVTLYHWFNIFVFLDSTVIMSELDWEKLNEEQSKKATRKIIECIKEKEFDDYFEALKKKKTVLVQDLDDNDSYPKEAALLVVQKDKLKTLIKENELIGKSYDFTQENHCQTWCKNENEKLGLGNKFSCIYINEYINSNRAMKAIGKFVKKFALDRMDDEESLRKKIKAAQLKFKNKMKEKLNKNKNQIKINK